jgi:LAGLIDADG endonuclease
MNNNKLDPNWVTGFTDAEGCFMINITKRETNRMKWQIRPCFQIKLHSRDKELLIKIKSFFNEIGSISFSNDNGVMYRVNKLNDIINIIIPHFNNYPLITQKQSDFLLFKEIVRLMNKSEHLNKDGIIKIINLKASLNKGLSDNLKINFPDIIKVERPKVNITTNINYNWIAGFFSGEGCFTIDIHKSNTHKIGYGVTLQILLTQNFRDVLLINNIRNVLSCGFITKDLKRSIIVLKVSKFENVYNKMIPLFNKHRIIGIKSLDYLDFCLVAELVNKKAHLTLEGLEEIRKIKLRMNKNRYDLYNNVK